MIKCIIVEDEIKSAKLLEEYISQTPFLQLEAVFNNAEEVLDHLNLGLVDLIFSDINLPGISGMELAGLLSGTCKLIFITAYSQYAVSSYEMNASDYLLKPVTYDRFAQACEKAKDAIIYQRYALEQGVSFLKTGKKIIKVDWTTVLYLEAHKEYVAVVSRENKTLIYKRMKDLNTLLPKSFVRVHNSFIINITHVEKVEGNMIRLLDKMIPIGNTYKDAFYTFLHKRTV